MKIQAKMYNPNMDLKLDPHPELTPQKVTSYLVSHMVIIALNGSSCKKCIISSLDTYILNTHEKKLHKMEFTVENGNAQ